MITRPFICCTQYYNYNNNRLYKIIDNSFILQILLIVVKYNGDEKMSRDICNPIVINIEINKMS